MSIKGKLFGGVLGFFTAGIWGALIGAGVGHLYDSSNDTKEALKKKSESMLELICAGISKIAKMDGVVSEAEIAEIERIFAELEFDSDTREVAIRHFRRYKQSAETLDEITRRFAEEFTDSQSREVYFRILLRVAMSDNEMSEAERIALKSVAEILDIAFGGQTSTNTTTPNSELANAYDTIGAKYGAPMSEVKKIYHAKCKDLHPDVLRSRGIGEYAVAALEAELKRINDAYEIIKKHSK